MNRLAFALPLMASVSATQHAAAIAPASDSAMRRHRSTSANDVDESVGGDNIDVPDVGHAIQLERPDVVVAAIYRAPTAVREIRKPTSDACARGRRAYDRR